MNIQFKEQIETFFVFFISGIIIGIIFDIFRVLRKSFKTSDFITCIEDIIFGLSTGFFLIFIIYIYNNGDLRCFLFLSLFLGIILYYLTISKYFMKANILIMSVIKKIIIYLIKIILIPIKYLKKFFIKILNQPFMILIINFKKIKYKLFQKK